MRDRTWCSRECEMLTCDRNKAALQNLEAARFADLEGTFLCENELNRMEKESDT